MNADPYTNLTTVKPPKFAINFVNGIHVTLPDDGEAYDVMLYDGHVLKSVLGHCRGEVWFPFLFFAAWRVVVECRGVHVFTHDFNPHQRRVLISLASKSMGDSLAWVPALARFQRQHEAHVIACTHHNDWFAAEYPDIEWVAPGLEIPNLYAATSIGWFYHATDSERPH